MVEVIDFTGRLGRVAVEAGALSLTRTAAALRSASRVAQVGGWEVNFVTQQTFFSPELCELLGSPPLPEMPIDDALVFWVEDDRSAFQTALDQAANGGERLRFEGRSVTDNGVVRWWRLLGEPEFAGGRCVAIRGAAQDITDWKIALERERAAVRAADDMSGLLATMSHEIRTPLNGVLGMAQAMGRDELSPRQRQRLKVIESSGEALLSLLNDLLDLSKIEAGQIVLEPGLLDTQSLADGVRSVFSALVRDKGVALSVTLKPAARGCWAGDPHRIRQVLHNLVSNAVKFTDKGSVAVCISQAAGRLVLRVRDTGIGIAQSKLAHVFDKFVQADASMTRRYGGSGLGLTIARDLVTMMGGSLNVESTEGLGATFTVSLPLARAEAPKPKAASAGESLATTGRLRVLAVEDNVTNQLVLKTLLAEFGIEPAMVANGQEALDAWRASPWDIVLMDIQMPVMDGVTAVKLLRAAEAREGRARTPIIAVTANAADHHRADYLAAGMDDLVAKPINIVSLLQTMDAVLTLDTMGHGAEHVSHLGVAC